jgi:hypothetical protein
MSDNQHSAFIEPFVTLAQAAVQIGIPLFKLRRTARARLFPIYAFGNGRRLARMSEIIAAIERSRQGGER